MVSFDRKKKNDKIQVLKSDVFQEQIQLMKFSQVFSDNFSDEQHIEQENPVNQVRLATETNNKKTHEQI